MENLRNIPWPRVFAEGAAIVVSILLAFWIQAWWDYRSDRFEEIEVLSALQEELHGNIKSIESSLAFRKTMVGPITELLQASAADREIPSPELDELLGSLVWGDKSDPSTGVFQSLVQGGQLAQITSTGLRARIASLSKTYQRLEEAEGHYAGTARNWLSPYLYKKSDLAQITNAQPGPPGSKEAEYPPLPVGPARNHQNLLEDQEFINILVNLYWDHYDAMATLTQTKEQLAALNVEIGKSVSP
jgi:hypothetical protein